MKIMSRFFPPDFLTSQLSLKIILIVSAIAILSKCSIPAKSSPPGDPHNGGLILPGNFEAVVVADSIGRARHITVNDNGDVYVKLTYNDAMHGSGGTVGLRDNNNDGKADVIAYFGDYK